MALEKSPSSNSHLRELSVFYTGQHLLHSGKFSLIKIKAHEDPGPTGEKDRERETCILAHDHVLHKICFLFPIIGDHWLD